MWILLSSSGVPKEKFSVYMLLSSLIMCPVCVFEHLNIGGEDAPITFEDEVQIGIGADKDEKEAYMQKRMVDFIKRRVLLLEKVLNAEYHKVFLGDQGAVEELPQSMTSEGAVRTNYIPSMPVIGHKQTISREERPAPPTKPFPICKLTL
jgi:hypothetical protein